MHVFILKLKGACRSSTMWFNALFIFLMTAFPTLLEHLPEAEPYIPTHIYHYAFSIATVGNLLIRFFLTTRSLEAKAVQAAMNRAAAGV